MTTRRLLLTLLLTCFGLALWPWTSGAFATEPPGCVAATAGTVACIAGRLCACGYERGGSMTDRLAGYGWNCGVLRPDCHRAPSSPRSPDLLDELRLIVPAPPIRKQASPRQRPLPRPVTERPP